MRLAILLLCLSVAVEAQLAAPNESGVTMGHLHLSTKDPEAHKKFWVDTLGGKAEKLGSSNTDVISMVAETAMP